MTRARSRRSARTGILLPCSQCFGAKPGSRRAVPRSQQRVGRGAQALWPVFAYFGCTLMWLVLEVAVLLPSALLELGERERLRPRRGRMLAGAALPGGG